MLLFPETVVSIFMKDGEAELLAMASYAIRIYAMTFLVKWFSFAIQGFLTALEIPLPATILSVANALIVPIALLPVLWPLGLNGIWLNTPITALIIALLALIFFIQLRIKLTDGTQPQNNKTNKGH